MDINPAYPVHNLPTSQTHLPGTRRKNQRTVEEESYLRGGTDTLLPLQHLSGPKELGRVQVHHKPITSQQIYPCSNFSHDKPYQSGLYDQTSGLDDVHRLTRRLLPCPNKTIPTQVPGIPVRGETVFFQGTPVWLECSPIHIYQNPSIPTRHLAPTGCTSSSISGRLDYLGTIARRHKLGIPTDEGIPILPGIHHQQQENSGHSHIRYGLARGPLAGLKRRMGHPSRERQQPKKNHSILPWSPILLSQRMGEINRCSEFRLPNTIPYKAHSSTPIEASTPRISLEKGPTKDNPSPFKECSPTMARPYCPKKNRVLQPSRSDDPPLDGCVNNRMGGSHRVSFSLRPLVIPGNQDAYQPTRSPSSKIFHRTLGTQTDYDTPIYRQCSSPLLDKEVISEIPSPPPGGYKANSTPSQQEPEDRHIQDFNSAQLQSRWSQQTNPPNRLGSSPGDLQRSHIMEREHGDRSYGDGREQQAPSLSIPKPRSTSSRVQCNSMELEPMESNLHLSPEVADSHSHQEAPDIQEPRSDHSASLHVGSLVPLHSVENAVPEGTVSRRSSTEWTSRLREVDRLQFLKELYAQDFGHTISDKLSHAYRSGTIRQGESNWRTFQKWLPPDVTTITARTVMEFLVYLEDDLHLNARTILNYRSRLKQPFQLAFNLDLNSEAFSLLARNQFLSNPPQRRKTPKWSIDRVLEKLASDDFNLESTSPQHVLLKTLFLTALASGNRVSELAAISRQGVSFTVDGATLLTNPEFIFKNQSIRNPLSPTIQFPALEGHSSLCPVQALKVYIGKTESLPHGDFLFVNPSSGKPLAAGRLSYWLVKAIKLGDPLAQKPSAHDVRKLSHSLAFARGLDPQEILKNGFWHNPSVFVRKYLISGANSTNKCVAGRHK